MTVAAVTQAGVCDLHISQENYFSHGVTTDMKMVRRQILPYRLYMIRKRDVWHGCYSFFPFEVISCELLSSGKGGEGMNMKHFREFWQINIIILFFYFFWSLVPIFIVALDKVELLLYLEKCLVFLPLSLSYLYFMKICWCAVNVLKLMDLQDWKWKKCYGGKEMFRKKKGKHNKGLESSLSPSISFIFILNNDMKTVKLKTKYET